MHVIALLSRVRTRSIEDEVDLRQRKTGSLASLQRYRIGFCLYELETRGGDTGGIDLLDGD